MNKIIIDCSLFTDKKQMHEVIRKELGNADYYGDNLDALHDKLTAISTPTSIVFKNTTVANITLGKYFDSFVTMLFDAAEYNENLDITFKY